MKTYELTYIISPELTSDQIASKEKEVESAIQSREGVIIKQAKPMAKTLAYPIGRFSSGFFGVLEFQIEEEKLPEVKAMLSTDAKIIREMVTIKEPARIRKARRTRKEEMPSILSDKKAEKKVSKGLLDMVKEFAFDEKKEKTETKAPAFEDKKEDSKETEPKGKVDLKDIEQELQDILGE